MLLIYKFQTKEQEDDTVWSWCQCFGSILDSRIRFLTDVLEGVSLGSDAIADDADDTRPVENFSIQESRVSSAEDNKWINNTDMFGESSD